MFFWLKGVILTTLRGHPVGSLGPLGAPGAPVPHKHRISLAYDYVHSADWIPTFDLIS